MADTKISAMTAATAVANADIAPIVQGGTNKKATRTLLLTAASGENIAIRNNAGSAAVAVGDAGDFDVVSSNVGNIRFTDGGSSHQCLVIQSGGAILIQSSAGQNVVISGQSGGQISIDGSGNISLALTVGGTSINIAYLPATPSDWAGTPPDDLWEAVDRLAAANPGA